MGTDTRGLPRCSLRELRYTTSGSVFYDFRRLSGRAVSYDFRRSSVNARSNGTDTRGLPCCLLRKLRYTTLGSVFTISGVLRRAVSYDFRRSTNARSNGAEHPRVPRCSLRELRYSTLGLVLCNFRRLTARGSLRFPAFCERAVTWRRTPYKA